MRFIRYGVLALAASIMPAYADETMVAGIVFQQDSFMHAVTRGMEAAGKEAGVTVLTGNSDNKIEKEANLIDTYVARGVKAVVIGPLNEDASVPALQRAADKGVKIVTFMARLNGDLPIATVGSSPEAFGSATGVAAARFMKEKLDGHATVALIGFKSQLAWMSNGRTQGFLTEAKKGGELTVAAEQDAWLPEKAVTVVTDILTAHPEINMVFAANEGATIGATEAVRRANKQGKVFVFGIDGSEQILQFLRDDDGVLVDTTAAQPKVIGQKAVEIALDALAGKPVPKHLEVPVVPLYRFDKAALDDYAREVKEIN